MGILGKLKGFLAGEGGGKSSAELHEGVELGLGSVPQPGVFLPQAQCPSTSVTSASCSLAHLVPDDILLCICMMNGSVDTG